MTDFLSNLVDRALGQAPVLERRRPSFFEVQPETEGLNSPIQGISPKPVEESIFESVEAPVLPAVHSPDQEGRPASRARRPPRVPLESPVGPAKPGLGHVAQSKATQEINRPPPTSPPMPTILPKAREEESKRVALPVLRVEQQSPRVAVIETIVEKEVPISEAVTRSVPRAEAFDRTRHPIQIFPPPTQSTTFPKIDPDRICEITAHRETIREPRHRDRSSKLMKPVSKAVIFPIAKPQSPVPSPVAPEIRVTIGRLEIRAVTAALARPVRAQQPASPRLSLESYLRSRSGGSSE
jgi:hypothetical protein